MQQPISYFPTTTGALDYPPPHSETVLLDSTFDEMLNTPEFNSLVDLMSQFGQEELSQMFANAQPNSETDLSWTEPLYTQALQGPAQPPFGSYIDPNFIQPVEQFLQQPVPQQPIEQYIQQYDQQPTVYQQPAFLQQPVLVQPFPPQTQQLFAVAPTPTAPALAPVSPQTVSTQATPVQAPSEPAPVQVSIEDIAAPTASTTPPAPLHMSATHLFEANSLHNTSALPSDIRPFREMRDSPKRQHVPDQLRTNWELAIGNLSKQDFEVYFYRQNKIATVLGLGLPPLPDWIADFVFGKDTLSKKAPSSAPITEHHVANRIIQKSQRGAGSSKGSSKGKGKARADPYPQHGRSTRPSPLVG